jgi:hypothetical protein
MAHQDCEQESATQEKRELSFLKENDGKINSIIRSILSFD